MQKDGAGYFNRVCRAWQRTSGMEVAVPGVRRTEGWEKDEGGIVRRGPEEAQSKSAGRGTGTGSGVWYVRDEWACNRKTRHLR
jgi:hypothetical protein